MTASGFPLPFVAGYRLYNCTRLSWLWATIPVEGGGHSSPITGKTVFLVCPVCRSALHVAVSLRPLCSSYRSTGSLPKGEACLSKAGATLQWIPPAFPSRIGFDPCTASVLSSEGRGGVFNGNYADCSFFRNSITYGLSIRFKCYPLNP